MLQQKAAPVFAALVIGLGCTGCKDDSTQPDATEALAATLLANLDFEDGTVIDGDFPPTTLASLVIEPVSDTVIASPRATTIMAIETEHPDEDTDPLAATLIRFEGGKGFIEVSARRKEPARSKLGAGGGGGGGDGTGADAGTTRAGRFRVSSHFKARAGICDQLCDKIHATTVTEASKLKSGEIGGRNRRTFVLDCRADGRHERCTGDDSDDVSPSVVDGLLDPAPDAVTDAGPRDGGLKDEPTPQSACIDVVAPAAPRGCQRCLCDNDEVAASACGDKCWNLLVCSLGTCERDSACAEVQCAEYLPAEAEAGAIVPKVDACWDSCVEGIVPGFDPDAGQ